jgi:hypothetical protein
VYQVEGDTYLHAAPMFHLADGASNYALSWIASTPAQVLLLGGSKSPAYLRRWIKYAA